MEKIRKAYNSSNKLSKLEIQETNKEWINYSLAKEALMSFGNKKAAGPDEIKPILFDYLPDNFIRHLVFIFKCVIKLRYTPLLWKGTKVIFIPKPGKPRYDSPKSFRPISLSNYFLKTLEKLMCWKMDQDLRKNPLHKAQHGFTKSKGTESAASNVVSYIENNIYNLSLIHI